MLALSLVLDLRRIWCGRFKMCSDLCMLFAIVYMTVKTSEGVGFRSFPLCKFLYYNGVGCICIWDGMGVVWLLCVQRNF